jgi:hypothetical protein
LRSKPGLGTKGIIADTANGRMGRMPASAGTGQSVPASLLIPLSGKRVHRTLSEKAPARKGKYTPCGLFLLSTHSCHVRSNLPSTSKHTPLPERSTINGRSGTTSIKREERKAKHEG